MLVITELSLLLSLDPFVKYNKQVLVHELNIRNSEIDSHIDMLIKFGFVEIPNGNPEIFQLTERCFYFKIGIEKEITIIEQSRINKGVELFFTFLNLKK